MVSAKELRQKSFLACEKELKQIEGLMASASEKGELSVYLPKISDGAKQALKDSGYIIKISIVEEHKNEWRVEW
jgi:hypothetical protein